MSMSGKGRRASGIPLDAAANVSISSSLRTWERVAVDGVLLLSCQSRKGLSRLWKQAFPK